MVTINFNPLSGEFDFTDTTAASGTASTASATFDNTDLAAGVYTFNHALAKSIVTVQVRDNSGNIVLPDEVTKSDTSNELIDLSSYGAIAGTWTITATG